MAALLAVVLLVLGLGASFRVFQVSRRETLWERGFSAVLPLLVAGAAIMLIERVASAPVFEWNEAKLAPIFLPVSLAKTQAGVTIFGARVWGTGRLISARRGSIAACRTAGSRDAFGADHGHRTQ